MTGKAATATRRVFEMIFAIDIGFSMETVVSGSQLEGEARPRVEWFRVTPGSAA